MSLIFVPSDGLGNLLFQHHAAYAFARKNGLKLRAPGWYYDVRPKFGEYSELFKHVEILGDPRDAIAGPDYFQDPTRWRIRNAVRFGPGPVYLEPGHTYAPIPSEARVIAGYFQSWKYFSEFRTEIRDLLRSNVKDLWERQKARYKGGVCVHVRWGGDGLDRPHIHPITSKEYYKKALALFPGHKFLVFCEDPGIVKQWDDVWAGHDVEFVDEPGALETLFLMSCCEHFIIANSSLSLNAYYLRENETARIVAPSDWFGPAGAKFDMNDLIDNGTII